MTEKCPTLQYVQMADVGLVLKHKKPTCYRLDSKPLKIVFKPRYSAKCCFTIGCARKHLDIVEKFTLTINVPLFFRSEGFYVFYAVKTHNQPFRRVF
jgi:hypothetical protein